MIVEDFSGNIQQAEERGIRDRIKNAVAGFATHDDIANAQNRELLRHIGRFYVQEVAELVDTLFPISQRIQNSNPDRVSQSLKELSLENRQLLWHSNHRICMYSNPKVCECQVQS